MVQEEREDSFYRSAREIKEKGKTKESTGWRGQSESQRAGEEKRNDRLVVATESCGMAQALAEKLGHTGPAKKERVASVPQSEQLASMPELSLPKQKGTEPSVQIIRSCGGRESRWTRERGDQRVSMGRKKWNPQ